MSPSNPLRAYGRGVAVGAPFLLVVVPFAMVFGVAATEAGLSVAETMGFSVVVIAGAAQFTALQLMTENAPVAVVLASALAVNLRMVMYSASLAPHLSDAPLWQRALVAYFNVDQTYAASVLEYETRGPMTTAEKVAYFVGVATPVCPVWYAATLAGAVLGGTVLPGYGLDFAVPLAFIALVAPALRTPAHVGAALAAVVVALVAGGLPYNLGLLVAGLAGMRAGAVIEARMPAR